MIKMYCSSVKLGRLHCFWQLPGVLAQTLVLKFLSTTLVVLYDYAVDYVIFVEEAHWYPELSHVEIRLCLLQTFYSEIISDPHEFFPLKPLRFGSPIQPVLLFTPRPTWTRLEVITFNRSVTRVSYINFCFLWNQKQLIQPTLVGLINIPRATVNELKQD